MRQGAIITFTPCRRHRRRGFTRDQHILIISMCRLPIPIHTSSTNNNTDNNNTRATPPSAPVPLLLPATHHPCHPQQQPAVLDRDPPSRGPRQCSAPA